MVIVLCSIFHLMFQLEKYVFHLSCERLKNIKNFIPAINYLPAIKLVL